MSLALVTTDRPEAAEAASLWPEKVVVAHRGASGYLPEHTLEAKAMAYAMDVQYLEQDVVMSKDDQLIVLHDTTLDRTTDVASKFPGRARADGQHYVVDFTLEELLQLNVTEGFSIAEDGTQTPNYPGRYPLWQGTFKLHTFAQEIEMIQGMNKATGKDVGIYPEIKSPAFHRQEGKDISVAIIAELKRFGYTTKEDKVYLQTFEFDELKRVHDELFPAAGIAVKLVQLIGDDPWMVSSQGIAEIARYADGMGPEKGLIIDRDSTMGNLIISNVVSDAHSHGMEVHPYTFRLDQGHIPAYASSFEHMLELFYVNANVDGVFTDFPDRAVEYLKNR